ncbi:MAG: acyl-CoA dehydrogenase family protein [Hyphomicrobiales bacterium]
MTATPPPLARARAVAPLIAAAAEAIEAACELPAPLLDALHEASLFRTLLPRALGGDELAPADYVEVMEVIAAADASTAWCIGQSSGCSMAAAYLRPDNAAEIWGDDPRAVLVWGARPQGLAKVVDGGFVVTGTWSFASGSRHATWLGGHSRVQERDGTLRRGADGEPIERSMLFRKQRAVMTANWNVMGLRGTGSDTYSVTDLFVPEEYTVIRDDPADRRQAGTLYKFSSMHLYASGFGAVALGIARATLDAFKSLAREKTPWAAARMLRDSPVVQREVALAEAKLGAARAFLIQTLKEIFADLRNADAMTLDQRMRIRMAATFATHQAKEVVDVAYHQAGATAIFDANPFERRFRDINTVTQQVQASTTHFETVGAHLLGLSPPLRFI